MIQFLKKLPFSYFFKTWLEKSIHFFQKPFQKQLKKHSFDKKKEFTSEKQGLIATSYRLPTDPYGVLKPTKP